MTNIFWRCVEDWKSPEEDDNDDGDVNEDDWKTGTIWLTTDETMVEQGTLNFDSQMLVSSLLLLLLVVPLLLLFNSPIQESDFFVKLTLTKEVEKEAADAWKRSTHSLQLQLPSGGSDNGGFKQYMW